MLLNREQLPKHMRIVEVGPRDGLQNEAKPIPTNQKQQFIEKLAAAGLREIEVTSFVRPDRIPQLADAVELTRALQSADLPTEVQLSALVPNMKGIESAHAQGVTEVAIFLASSDAFSQRNINATVDESFARVAPVMDYAKAHGIRVRGYLSTVFGCPYDGAVAPDYVVELTQRMLGLGVYEVSLGDTIGIGTPGQVAELLAMLLASIPAEKLAMHFHDTRGMAMANILTSLQMGIANYDASAGGLGGCPYAKGASGNVATEELVYLADSLGIETGIDLEKLIEASSFMLAELGIPSPSKLHRVLAG